MAILFMDNFEHYGTGDHNSAIVDRLLDGVYAELSAVNSYGIVEDPDPGVTTPVFYCGSTNGGTGLRFALPVAGDVVGVALRLWMDGLPSSTTNEVIPIEFRDAGNARLYGLRVNTTGTISIVNPAGTTVTTTTTPVLTANAWKHIEFKCVISATVGVLEVRVEGVPVIALTSQNTGTTNIAQWILGNEALTGAVTSYWKDMITWDDSGTVANDFIGPCSVFSCDVDGDVSSGWTKSTGSADYALLDEATPNDSDYISADSTPPAASIMTFENLPADVVAIRGVQTVVRMEKSDGGDATVQVGLLSNGSEDTGTDRPISTAYTYYWDVSSLDPDTGAAWTPSAVDAATIKINRTT